MPSAASSLYTLSLHERSSDLTARISSCSRSAAVFVGTLAGKVRPSHALPERVAGTQIHDAETFSELLQNAPEPKQFSTARYPAKRVYFLLGSSFISPGLHRQGFW